MSVRTGLILLGLFAALFFGAAILGVGVGDGGDDALKQDHNWVDFIAGMLVDEQRMSIPLRDIVPLEGGDGSSPLASRQIVIPAGTRTFKILPSQGSMPVRSLKLQLEAGSPVILNWQPSPDDQDRRSPQIEFTLKPSQPEKLVIESPGGTLTLSIAGLPGQPASIRLLEK